MTGLDLIYGFDSNLVPMQFGVPQRFCIVAIVIPYLC